MNKVFNFSRFGKYFMHDLNHQKRNIGIMVLFFMILPIFFYIFFMISAGAGQDNFMNLFKNLVDGPQITYRKVVFMLISGIFMIVYPSKAYGELTDKAKGSAWLMVPASRFEKFLSMILITLVVVPAIYFVGYLLCDYLVCLFDKSCGSAILADGLDIGVNGENVDTTVNATWFLVSTVLQTASVYLLGALLFKKWKIVGTIFTQFVIGNVLIILFAMCFSSFGTNWENWFENWIGSHVEIGDATIKTTLNIILAAVVIVCSTWSWFRIKRLQH